MKSELRINTPNIKITAIVGFFATMLIIILSLLFRFEFGLILLSIAGLSTLAGGTVVFNQLLSYRHGWRLNNLQLEKQKQELRLATYQADKAQLEAFTITFPNTHRIVTMPNSPIQLIEGVVKQLPATIANDDNLPDLLETIGNEDCVMFLGPRGSGKSETAAHWIKSQGHLFIVCDPKEEDFNWPSNCKVYRRFNTIINVTDKLQRELQRRISGQLKNEQSITIFYDELHTLMENDIDVVRAVVNIATIGRSYNIHSSFTGHAMTQDYLGMRAAKLLDNFAQVRLTKNHNCFVNLGEGEYQVKSPGVYRQQIIINQDDRIRQLINSGYSNYQICQQIWGNRNRERYEYIDSLR